MEQIHPFNSRCIGRAVSSREAHRKSCEAGLPQSGKNIWKMKFFPGQGKVREFCGWSGKFRKNLESQGKVRKFENKWLWQADFRKFIYTVQEGKDVLFQEIV